MRFNATINKLSRYSTRTVKINLMGFSYSKALKDKCFRMFTIDEYIMYRIKRNCPLSERSISVKSLSDFCEGDNLYYDI